LIEYEFGYTIYETLMKLCNNGSKLVSNNFIDVFFLFNDFVTEDALASLESLVFLCDAKVSISSYDDKFSINIKGANLPLSYNDCTYSGPINRINGSINQIGAKVKENQMNLLYRK